MAGTGSNKPIVFVFGAKKGDAESRKKNLSAINTQVAYRAHERRREKKNRQRAQAKEEGKVDQQTLPALGDAPSSSSPVSSSTSQPNHQIVNFHHYEPQGAVLPTGTTYSGASKSLPSTQPISRTIETYQFQSGVVDVKASRPTRVRRPSDNASEASSDNDAVWSLSPSSNRYSTPATELSSCTSPAYTSGLTNGYFERGLDPFFRLPTVASDREKWLVHFYFREMGHIGFGTHNNSLFCPDRDWVSSYVSSKSLCFQWVLILAEEQLGRMGVSHDQTQTIDRKSKAYGQLNSILASKTVNRDEGISGIMFAAIVDVAQASMHLQALDRFINQSGSFDGFLEGPLGNAHPEHVATVYAFGKCPVASMEDLKDCTNTFLNALKSLYGQARQEQGEKRRIRNRRPWDTLSRQVVDGNGVLVPANQDEHLRYYTKTQDDCFNSDCLAPLLNSTLRIDLDFSSQVRHLATLIQTSMILKEFENNYLARAMFLKRLKHVAELSTARDPQTGFAYLSHAGLLLINAYVRQEVQTYIDRTKDLVKAVKISKVVVAALKVFGLLSAPTRSLIASWLRDWLVNNDSIDNTDFAPLHEQHFLAMSQEITESWLAEAQVKSRGQCLPRNARIPKH